jgi:hypothetical protein
MLGAILGLFSPVATQAQQGTGEAGLIFGRRHVFSIAAPKGWVLDVRSDRNNGLPAVLYRVGESWRDGSAVMYVSTTVPDSGETTSVAQVIADDAARFRAADPSVTIDTVARLVTQDHRHAEVRLFRGSTYGNLEAVAYIPAPTVVATIVLTAHSKHAYDAALPAFRCLVGSYAFVTDSITISK